MLQLAEVHIQHSFCSNLFLRIKFIILNWMEEKMNASSRQHSVLCSAVPIIDYIETVIGWFDWLANSEQPIRISAQLCKFHERACAFEKLQSESFTGCVEL